MQKAYKLDALISKLGTDASNKFIVWRCAETVEYNAFDNAEQFYWQMTKIQPSARNYYETVRDGVKQKPRFDIDIALDSLPIMVSPKDIVNEVIFAIKHSSPDIATEQILIFNSNGEKKHSYHIVIDGWYHNNSLEAKTFYTKIASLVPGNMKKFVDAAVYKSTQQFRLLGSTKRGENRFKIQERSWIFNGKTILYPERETPLNDFLHSLLTYTENCSLLEIEIPTFDKGVGKSATTVVDGADIEAVIPDGFVLDGEKDYGYRLKRIKPSHCLVCARIHGDGNSSKGDNARIVVDGNNIYLYCFRNTDGSRYLLDTIVTSTEEITTKTPDGEITSVREENKRVKLTELIKSRQEKVKPIAESREVFDIRTVFLNARNRLGNI